jgi:hypothetical protein
MTNSVVATSVGPADVLHRLALGVELVDAQTRRPIVTSVRVGQEVAPRMRPQAARFEDAWPCLDFESNGTARFKLRHQIGGQVRIKVNTDGSAPRITVRIDDDRRRFVPRRFRLPLWTRRELERADPTPGADPTGPYVPLASRLLRPFIYPGVGYVLPRGITAIRCRVVSTAGATVRWPRVFATGPGDVRVGAAHGDEHGQFLLIITSAGTTPQPVPTTFDVDLNIVARDPNTAPAPDSADRVADLVVENLNRSSVPPSAGDLDSLILRGVSMPPGYVRSLAPWPNLTITVGELLTLSQPIVFRR